jgi:hypothetical protein
LNEDEKRGWIVKLEGYFKKGVRTELRRRSLKY